MSDLRALDSIRLPTSILSTALALLLLCLPSALVGQELDGARPAAEPAERRVASLDAPSLQAAARASEPGDRLVIEGVPLFDGPLATLELERFRVFKEDTVFELRENDGAISFTPRDNRLFRGRVQGQSDSLVFLAVMESGDVRGLVGDDDRIFLVGTAPETAERSARVDVRQLQDTQLKARPAPFHCANEDHPLPREVAELLQTVTPAVDAFPLPDRIEARAAGPDYAVDVAIDTDHEFYQLFGNSSAATDYVETLFGAIATIYERDVDTQLQIPYLRLWSTSSDPWSSSTSNALSELMTHWRTYQTGVNRTVTHLLRGAGGNYGVAYVGVLCSHETAVYYNNPNYDHAFGLTTSISGSYSSSNTIPVWDLVAVAHEIGHNFNSPHTHCYNIYTAGGPIDQCYSGDTSGGNACYSGTTSVPSDGGTIMSYCHLRSGGFNNMNLWFGREGYYGTESERVPERMLAHLASAKSSDCLAELESGDSIFEDGFESGNTNSWSSGS